MCIRDRLKDALSTAIAASGKKVLLRKTGCMGPCSSGPLVRVDPQQTLYHHVDAGHAEAIVSSLGGEPVPDLQCDLNEHFDLQMRIVLENAGHIDPEKIDDYIARDGYQALLTVLTEMIDVYKRQGEGSPACGHALDPGLHRPLLLVHRQVARPDPADRKNDNGLSRRCFLVKRAAGLRTCLETGICRLSTRHKRSVPHPFALSPRRPNGWETKNPNLPSSKSVIRQVLKKLWVAAPGARGDSGSFTA